MLSDDSAPFYIVTIQLQRSVMLNTYINAIDIKSVMQTLSLNSQNAVWIYEIRQKLASHKMASAAVLV